MDFYLDHDTVTSFPGAPSFPTHKLNYEIPVETVPLFNDIFANPLRVTSSLLPPLASSCCSPLQYRLTGASDNDHADLGSARSVLEDVQKAMNIGVTYDSPNFPLASRASISDCSCVASKVPKEEPLRSSNISEWNEVTRYLPTSMYSESGQQILRVQAEIELPYSRNCANCTCEQAFGYELVPPLQGIEQPDMGTCMMEEDVTLSTAGPSTEQQLLLGQGFSCLSIQKHILERLQEANSPGSVGYSSVTREIETHGVHRNRVSAAKKCKEDQAEIYPQVIKAAGDKLMITKSSWNIVPHNVPAACEPPFKRHKLHGITMEQLLQAQRLQQAYPQSSDFRILDQNISCRKVADRSFSLSGKSGDFMPQCCSQLSPPTKEEAPLTKQQPARKPIATSVEPQSVAARERRRRISERIRILGQLIPGTSKLDTAGMLDQAIKYVQFLQTQSDCLENENWFESIAGNRHGAAMSPARMLLNRLVSSEEVQVLLAKAGYCLVTDRQAKLLKYVSQKSRSAADLKARPSK